MNKASDSRTSPFALNFGAALDDGTLFVCGVSLELEDRDVLHTIIWERYAETWQRYQWKNRTDGIAAHFVDGGATAVYMGFEGSLKVRSKLLGSSEERVEIKGDGPSTLRPLSTIRIIGDHLYVAGMRRMVYRRPLVGGAWARFDDGLRLKKGDLTIAGLNAIDGYDQQDLYAAGMNGEVWRYTASGWRRVDAPTNLDLFAVCCFDDRYVVVAGEKGALLVGKDDQWTALSHSFKDEVFTCIERWNRRCFVCSDAGSLYELILGASATLVPMILEQTPSVAWIAASASRVYFVGTRSIVSLGDDGLRDESPPTALMF